MAWNGSGTYVLPSAYTPAVNGTIIDAADYNGALNDIATGITNALAKDGQNAATANIPMGSFKFTGLAAGSADGQSVRYEQVFLQAEETVAASVGSTDFSSTRASTVVLTASGTPAITGFGTMTAGTRRYIRVGGALSVTYNSTSMITPGLASLTFAAGDTFEIVSLGSGNWKMDSYSLVSGVSVRLSAIGAANIAGTPISNGDYGISWSWSLTTASGKAFQILESAASSATGSAHLLYVASSSNSTAAPFFAQWTGATTTGEFGFKNDSTRGAITIKAATLAAGPGGGVAITAGSGASTSNGGAITLTGGNATATSGTGGSISLTGGTGLGTDLGGDINLTGGNSATATAAGTVNLIGGTTSGTVRGAVTLQSRVRIMPGDLTITSGAGTGATIAGSHAAFLLTLGTSAGTTIVLGIPNALAGTPVVVVNGSDLTIACKAVATTNTITITTASGMANGSTIQGICLGKQ